MEEANDLKNSTDPQNGVNPGTEAGSNPETGDVPKTENASETEDVPKEKLSRLIEETKSYGRGIRHFILEDPNNSE